MARIRYLTQIQFEFGAIALLKQASHNAGITHPLIVTDPGAQRPVFCKKRWAPVGHGGRLSADADAVAVVF
jgi:alcohol dehydrogenase class IV